MKEIDIDLKNCYGIRDLQAKVDFSSSNTIAIYAPNGVMKTSFARTFKDFSQGSESIRSGGKHRRRADRDLPGAIRLGRLRAVSSRLVDGRKRRHDLFPFLQPGADRGPEAFAKSNRRGG